VDNLFTTPYAASVTFSEPSICTEKCTFLRDIGMIVYPVMSETSGIVHHANCRASMCERKRRSVEP
jgi:hypothetical protein